MKNLLLDSNILYPGLWTGKLQALKHLVEQAAIVLFIPDIVKREIITKMQSEVEASIRSATNEVRAINKKGIKHKEFSRAVSHVYNLLIELEEETQQAVIDDFEAWEKEFKVQVVMFDAERVNAVLDDYFMGKGAFQQQKSRKDIPDSLIHHTALHLQESVGEICFVAGDANLRGALANEEGIEVYASLEDFFELDGIKEVAINFELKPYLMSDGFNRFIVSKLMSKPNNFSELYLPDNIKNLEELAINAFGPELVSPQVETMENFTFLEVFDVGSDKFSAAISFKALATLNYISDYGSFLELERKTQRQVAMHSMNGDGLCDLSEPVMARFVGEAIFGFKEPKSKEDILRISENPKASGDDVIFEINLQKGYIIRIIQ